MLPTLSYKGERCIGDIFSVRWHNGKNLRRGDLIIFHSPDHASRLVCKRVLGLAGDTVCVDPTGKWADTSEHVLVPKGHVWVMGDNADGSLDSRKYGPVPLGLIHSRVVARVCNFSIVCLDFSDSSQKKKDMAIIRLPILQ
ncbi:peptidase S24/S26A/S26B/S26C [Flagelloscypha sp. PMI_526]|nr:peptidase S24/S26A/S26B/S26C [Flagelloscypha sp. PMI_526]